MAVDNLHPGVHVALARGRMDEAQLARAMAAGELASPQQHGNSWYFNIRLTGTGSSYRDAHKEYVWRDPSLYLNQGFLDRCNGLPVIVEHPDKQMLDTGEYRKRNVGSIVYPYIREDIEEVWGIARILDAPVSNFLRKNKLSTSPAVVFLPQDVNEKIELGDGKHLLIEGKPSLVDHVAICEEGVWDKGGPPAGVDVTDQQEQAMADNKETMEDRARKDEEENKKKEEQDAQARKDEAERKEREAEDARRADENGKIDKLLEGIKVIADRMDAIEEKYGDKRRADDDDDDKKKEADSRKDDDDDDKKKEADSRKDKGRNDDDPEKEKEQAAELRKLAAEEEAEAANGDSRKDGAGNMDWDAIRRKEGESDNSFSRRADEMAKRADSTYAKRADESIAAHCDRVAAAARAEAARKDNEHRLAKVDVIADAVAKLASRLDSVYDRIADRTDEDEVKFADIQARADGVYEALGDHAPRPMRGENTVGYRIRLARGLQKHSKTWGDSDLGAIARGDAHTFENIEGAIYADAMVAARTPTVNAGGGLREVKVKMPYGGEMTEFVGEPLAWMQTFMAPARAARLTTKPGQHAQRT